jgi:hypothetical protein
MEFFAARIYSLVQFLSLSVNKRASWAAYCEMLSLSLCCGGMNEIIIKRMHTQEENPHEKPQKFLARIEHDKNLSFSLPLTFKRRSTLSILESYF